MLNIPSQPISEVADAINIAEELGVRVDLADRVFEENEKEKEHLERATQL